MNRLLPFIVLILLIAAILSAPFIIRQDRYRAQMAATLSQRLGHKVVVGKLDGSLIPPALKLREVAVMNPAGDTPLLQVEQVSVPLNWQKLFGGKLVPRRIELKGWNAVLRRNPNGSWAWDEWFVPTGQLSQKSGWSIKAITFDRGECHAIDAYGPGPAEFVIQVLQGGWEPGRKYVSINGVFTSLPTPVSFLFQGHGQFLNNPDGQGVLAMTDESRQWKVEFKIGQGQLEATSQSDAWRFDTLYAGVRYYTRLPLPQPVPAPSAVLQGWQSQVNWQGSTMTVTQTATIASGRAEAKGAIFFHSDKPVARWDVALQGVNIQAVENGLWGQAPLEGRATGLAHFETVLSSAPWNSLSGRGALEIVEGRYFVPTTSSRGLARAHTMKYLLKKYPGFLGSGMLYQKASIHWQLKGGMFSFNDGFANLGDIKASLVGTYDIPRHGLDAYARVQISERSPALLKELPANYIYKGEGGIKIQPMHGRVQGTPGEWQLRAVRPSKIPPAVTHKLQQTIRSK